MSAGDNNAINYVIFFVTQPWAVVLTCLVLNIVGLTFIVLQLINNNDANKDKNASRTIELNNLFVTENFVFVKTLKEYV